jgi:hypothetical protein
MNGSKSPYPFLEDDSELGHHPDKAEEYITINENNGNFPRPAQVETSQGSTQSSMENAQDLESILAQLSQYSASQQQNRQIENTPEEFKQLQQLQELQIHQQVTPPVPLPQSTSIHRSSDPRLNRNQTLPPPAQAPKIPIIDPATILEWPQALRCVTKLSAQNPNMAVVIKGVGLSDVTMKSIY